MCPSGSWHQGEGGKVPLLLPAPGFWISELMLFILDTIPKSAKRRLRRASGEQPAFFPGLRACWGSRGPRSGCSQTVLGRSHIHKRVTECSASRGVELLLVRGEAPCPHAGGPGAGNGLNPRTGREVGGEGWCTNPLSKAPRGRLWREPGASVPRTICCVGRDQAWPPAARGVTSFSPPPTPWLILSEIPSLSQGLHSFPLT